ncbi:hypothetical protein DY000_02042772 [Brassica cretica]|uniref:Jacalin-type lectin domain-containing protein n=1 Tax=Brassica cretica TaxID=69181 RepID=A0ABQ7B6I3_BRACR|nr:hypothetical protein DY000_02042772 [Brassica cretica]
MAQKVEAQGGLGGDVWDDGVYDGVRKVHVGQGQDGVSFINAVALSSRTSQKLPQVYLFLRFSSKSVGYILLSTSPKVFQERRTSPALKIEKYILFSGTQESFSDIRKAPSSPVYLKISRNVLLSTGPYLSTRESSNMVLVPQYKNPKEQHKKRNMRRRSDLNLARNEERGKLLIVQPTLMVQRP